MFMSNVRTLPQNQSQKNIFMKYENGRDFGPLIVIDWSNLMIWFKSKKKKNWWYDRILYMGGGWDAIPYWWLKKKTQHNTTFAPNHQLGIAFPAIT